MLWYCKKDRESVARKTLNIRLFTSCLRTGERIVLFFHRSPTIATSRTKDTTGARPHNHRARNGVWRSWNYTTKAAVKYSHMGGSPCLGACPRSDGRETTLVTSSCHSSLLSVCACVPHRPGFLVYLVSVDPLGVSLLISAVGSCCHLSGVLLWFRAVRRNVRSMCLHRHYLVLRCHLGQVLSLVKPTLLPVSACGHSPQKYLLSKRVSSHFLSWLPSFTVTMMVLGAGSC